MYTTSKPSQKIIVAIDSFKGSARSSKICEAVTAGCREALPEASVVTIPIADGGEGTLETLAKSLTNATCINIDVSNPIGSNISATYLIQGTCAYIELASAAGLTLLNEDERNPLYTSTYGVGQMIADALIKGCTEIVLGIGGSATNDAAMGILCALGYKFLDSAGLPLKPCGNSLRLVESIIAPNDSRIKNTRFTLLADVDNPFCGENGAAYVYAPQKGASPEMCKSLDLAMQHFAKVASDVTGHDLCKVHGGGAAGGVGASLSAFLNARICSGIDFLLETSGFDKELTNASLVITGEGKLDSQSMRGKVVSGIARRCKEHDIKVVAIAGCIDQSVDLNSMGIDAAYCINAKGTPIAVAMDTTHTLCSAKATAQRIISDLMV